MEVSIPIFFKPNIMKTDLITGVTGQDGVCLAELFKNLRKEIYNFFSCDSSKI